MSPRTLYLLACLAALAAVTYGAPNKPDWTPGLQELCKAFGHRGACKKSNYKNTEWNCSNVRCLGYATSTMNKPIYEVGPAHDGVQCAVNKICVAGVCKALGAASMPKQSPWEATARC